MNAEMDWKNLPVNCNNTEQESLYTIEFCRLEVNLVEWMHIVICSKIRVSIVGIIGQY